MISSLAFAPPAPTVDAPATVPAEPERSTATTRSPTGYTRDGELHHSVAIPLPRIKALGCPSLLSPATVPDCRVRVRLRTSPAPTIAPVDRHTAD